jgi:hypothetical protein
MAATKGRSANSGKEKYNTSNRSAPGERADFQEVEAAILAAVVERVTSEGDCIMFSRTSDGGAVHVRVLSEGIVAKWYPSTSRELEEVLRGIEDDLSTVQTA